MKAELAPKHSQQIGDNHVLWFESSNAYVVVSETTFQLLNAYLGSKNKETFIKYLKLHFNISYKQGMCYHTDLSNFLDDLNSEIKSVKIHSISKEIPNTDISKHYVFGECYIRINFSSEKLQQIIHPYLEHSSVKVGSDNDLVFDMFSEKNLIYLFKNKTFIESYNIADYHFLQGKFAIELIASIYKNSESDWMATFHASTVCNDDEAIMIIGDSGNGKSTLSAVLMAHGYDLLADDFTPMLAENQHLYRFPAAISIKKGAFPLVENLFDGFSSAEMQMSTSKPIAVKYLPPSRPFKTSQKHFECHKIVMVKYDDKAISQLRECPSEKILETFIPDSWISPQVKHSKLFLNWLKDIKFYELIYSDNNFAVTKFKELFAQ